MKALGPDSWGLAPALIEDIDEARARGVQVFADQYPYEASSTWLRAALVPGGVARADRGDRGTEQERPRVLEHVAKPRRRGGAASLQIASYRRRSVAGREDAERDRRSARRRPADRGARVMARGNASIVSFNMSEPDIAAIMTAPYTMASSDGGLRADRRRRSRIRATTARSPAGWPSTCASGTSSASSSRSAR